MKNRRSISLKAVAMNLFPSQPNKFNKSSRAPSAPCTRPRGPGPAWAALASLTILPKSDKVPVDDGEASHDRRRLLLLQDVDDELRLGDVRAAVGGPEPEVELLVVGLGVERPVEEDSAGVAVKPEEAAAFTQELKFRTEAYF